MINLFPVPKLPPGWRLVPIGTIKHPRRNINGYIIKRRLRYAFVTADGALLEYTRRDLKKLL